jgi:hypothetical protein
MIKLRKRDYYIKIYSNKIDVINLNTEIVITHNLLFEMASAKMVLLHFNFLKLVIKNLIDKQLDFTFSKEDELSILIQQISTENVLSKLEKKALLEIAIAAEPQKVVVLTHNKALDITEAKKWIQLRNQLKFN